MKIDDAISAHLHWKGKLATYLGQPDHTLDPDEVALDDKCALGRWLRGEAILHAGTFEYEDAVQKHAQFHKAVAELVRRAHSGHMLDDDIVLAAYMECEEASGVVVRTLEKLKRMRHPAEHPSERRDQTHCE